VGSRIHVWGNKISAKFIEVRTWLETERQIKIANLPTVVAAAIKSKYPGGLLPKQTRLKAQNMERFMRWT